MTVVAVVTAVDVRWVLAGRRDAVMTSATSANNLRMVDGKHGRPHITGVAVFADVARLHMRRVLTGGLRTVVAAETVAGNVHVIEVRR